MYCFNYSKLPYQMHNGWKFLSHAIHRQIWAKDPSCKPFIRTLQINELFLLHLELRRLTSIQPLIVLNNSIYSNEKEHAIHHQSCRFGVRQWPFQACQLNHLLTLWMGSFVTVSCHDYYFVTIDPSGLNEIQEKRLLIIIINPKAFSKEFQPSGWWEVRCYTRQHTLISKHTYISSNLIDKKWLIKSL